jgi:hypothetical protein
MMADLDEIDSALSGIASMVQFANRLICQMIADDARMFHIPYDDINLLDFAIIDIERRVKASRAVLYESAGPVSIKPVLSIVRDPA